MIGSISSLKGYLKPLLRLKTRIATVLSVSAHTPSLPVSWGLSHSLRGFVLPIYPEHFSKHFFTALNLLYSTRNICSNNLHPKRNNTKRAHANTKIRKIGYNRSIVTDKANPPTPYYSLNLYSLPCCVANLKSRRQAIRIDNSAYYKIQKGIK